MKTKRVFLLRIAHTSYKSKNFDAINSKILNLISGFGGTSSYILFNLLFLQRFKTFSKYYANLRLNVRLEKVWHFKWHNVEIGGNWISTLFSPWWRFYSCFCNIRKTLNFLMLKEGKLRTLITFILMSDTY